VRPLPSLERKRRLQRLVKGHAGLLYAEHIEGSGVELFQAVCARDLEGIVVKHRLGPYEPTPVTWFKVLNPDYTQKRGRRRAPKPIAGKGTAQSKRSAFRFIVNFRESLLLLCLCDGFLYRPLDISRAALPAKGGLGEPVTVLGQGRPIYA
jgi:hypothetical protein